MAGDFNSIESFLDNFKVKSTRFLFLIFSISTFLVLLIFFAVLNFNKRANNRLILDLNENRAHLLDKRQSLSSELLHSFNTALLYQNTQKETFRLQTVFNLRNSGNLLDEYADIASRVTEDTTQLRQFVQIRSLVTTYNNYILSILNGDNRLREVLTKSREEADSVSVFLFDEDVMPAEVTNLSDLTAALQAVENVLSTTENQLKIVIDRQIRETDGKNNFTSYLVLIVILALLILLFSRLILNRLNYSVRDLSQVLKSIAMGELPDLKLESEKEFMPISQASDELIHYLDSASEFAKRIGEGDFNFEFSPKSKKDALGNSLIEMRNRLQQVTREDKIRNWMNEGHAKFGEILRQHSDNLEKLGAQLISNLVDYMGGSQGALFVLKEEGENHYLELLAAYAYNRKKYVERRLEPGEGLAGQSFLEGKTIYLKDIRADHYNVVTGLGESKPTSLIIVPLREEEKIEGIIEIASLKEIQPYEIEFIESIGASIASSINAGKINETTRKLLDETREKAEQMKAQEEELRQNMEELAATQEQMERRNKELEEIQKKFDEERYLLNALLSSSNDRIYFKDLNSKFIRVSKSMITLFDKESESEIIGKSDFDFGFEEHAKVAFEDEQRIIRTGSPMTDVVEKEKWDDGRITWVSTTKNPLQDLQGKTVGTFGISRDVTKSKLMEQEIHTRKVWFDYFFANNSIGFIVLDQSGNVNFASNGTLQKIDKREDEVLRFEDIFKEPAFETVLSDVQYSTKRDEKFDMEFTLNTNEGEKIKIEIIAAGAENEDGTTNIFIVHP